jgi:nucleoid DNA-binding protein
MAGNKLTKSQFVAALVEGSGVPKKQVVAVLDALNAVVVEQLSKKGPGVVTLPGLLKLSVTDKPAVPARDGIDPFTKQPKLFKAKPASRAVKARPVKALKDSV